MAGRVMRPYGVIAKLDDLAGEIEFVHRRLRLHVKAEHPSLLDHLLV
jgi:hypothetical protein